MEQVFSAAFIATCLLIAAAALVITEKLKDLFKAGSTEAKYVLSVLSTAIIVVLVKYLGAQATWSLLLLIVGGTPLPDVPTIPVTQGWFYWIAMFGLSLFMAGGFYDYISALMKRRILGE